MTTITGTTSSLDSQIRPRSGTVGKALGIGARATLSAIPNAVRWVTTNAIRRFWEWAAVGFAIGGYTPL